MKIFISWSGDRSRQIAEAIRSWLPLVLQTSRPWMSDQDIALGSRWLSEISTQLSDSSIGIICVTPENQFNPWLLFEAGALSRTVHETRVSPLLYDLRPSDLSGPLSQFQSTELSQTGMERVVQMLNEASGESQLSSNDLAEVFEVWWPKLELRLAQITGAPDIKPVHRPIEDLLGEIVANTREQLRRENVRLEGLRETDQKMDDIFNLLRSSLSTFHVPAHQVMGNIADRLLENDSTSRMVSEQVGDLQQLMAAMEAFKADSDRLTHTLLVGEQDKPQNTD